jgi:pSer/pThr/pTyr-binding forkhead associated (FHA) protein
MFQVTPGGVVRDQGGDSPATTLSDLGLANLSGGLAATWTDMDGTAHKRKFRTRFRVGRDERCEIQLDSRQVSRTHAEIYPDDGVWWVRDLGSTNGTFVDGEPVENVPLPAESVISCAVDGPQINLKIETSVDTTQAMPSIRPDKKHSDAA